MLPSSITRAGAPGTWIGAAHDLKDRLSGDATREDIGHRRCAAAQHLLVGLSQDLSDSCLKAPSRSTTTKSDECFREVT
jgi:hypothetical protein